MLGMSPSGLLAAERASADARISAPLLPGLGAHGSRGRLDPDKVPWRAVGKLRTQHNFPPETLHFLVGYDGSRYAGHATGVRLETGPSYDSSRPSETRGSDWALVTLDTKLGLADRVLPMIGELPQIGSAIMLGGYQQDHPLILIADTKCRIVGRATDATGRVLLRRNCTGTSGDSGAPLLIEKGGKWYTAGINVAAELGVASGLAVLLNEARRHL